MTKLKTRETRQEEIQKMVNRIVVHELVHLIEPHHSHEFWLGVECAMPDYESRKRVLALLGGETL